MENVIILNLKSVFLPQHVLQSDKNTSFVENSLETNVNNPPFFDPQAVKEIQKMVDATNAKIVVTDNWFLTRDFETTNKWCIHNGLFINFHKKCITPKKCLV